MKNTTLIAALVILYALVQSSGSQNKGNTIKVPPKPKEQTISAANYTEWLTFAALIAKQAENIFGTLESAKNFLWGPLGPFYKTPVPEYDAGSQFWQDVNDIA